MFKSRNQSKPYPRGTRSKSQYAKEFEQSPISKLRRVISKPIITRPTHGRGKPRVMSERDIDALSKRVILPTLPVSDEEMARATHQDRGQKLARQDRWADLADRIRYADETRLATPAGETASLLLAYGARSDVVSAAEDALHDGAAPDEAGIEALEDVLLDEDDSYASALVVALAHLDIAWAWHCIRFDQTPQEALDRAQHHLNRAEHLLSAHDGEALNAPSVLAAQCALGATHERRDLMLGEDYAKLIALDPDGHGHMRALGRYMSRLLHKHPNALEVAARKTASQTEAYWQAGGYTWVYLDALMAEPGAITLLDPDLFVEGMENIIHRQNDQHIINQFTAFCAIAMAPKPKDQDAAAHAAARAQLHDCLDWLVTNHLHELHPLIWSQTLLAPSQVPALPSRRALVVKGRQTALRIIATRFAEEIADGGSLGFSPHGMYRLPAM
ncbi:MAG: hypothetical protein AAFZ04_04320 [Pseudomonadota bacterium]